MWNDKQRPQSGNPTAANRGRIMTILVSPFPQNGPRERERVADDDLKWRNGDRKTVGIISRSAGCHCRADPSTGSASILLFLLHQGTVMSVIMNSKFYGLSECMMLHYQVFLAVRNLRAKF